MEVCDQCGFDARYVRDVRSAMDVASARAAAVALAGSVSDADCLIPCPLDDAPTDVGRALLHLLHDLEHHVLDVRQGLAALGIAASPAVYPADAPATAPAV